MVGDEKMKVFEEMADSKRIRKYGDRAMRLGVSIDLLEGNAMKYGLPIHKLITSNLSCEAFDRKVRTTLYGSNNTDFYDFSLLMGLYFGTYNAYGYLFISNDVKKEVIEVNPNRVDTKRFIKQYHRAIYEYFSNFYGFTNSQIDKFIGMMGEVVTDNQLYNKPCIQDMGKILIGVSYLYDKEDIKTQQSQIEKMISTGYIISEFDHRNDKQGVQTTGLKK